MYTYKVGISAQEHDQFAKASQQTNLLQSSSWAKIKDNWGNERIGFYKDGLLVASASVLIQPLPLGFTLIYIPRGPIMDYQDKELVAFVLTSLRTFAKSKRALFIKFDPVLLLTKSSVGQEADAEDISDTLQAIDILKEAGCEWTGRTSDISENIQPRFQANIYAENFSEENLPKKTKQLIRTCKNKGVFVTFGKHELLEDFSNLMKKTEDRKQISLRGIDYYRKLLDTYPEDSYITMSMINLKERLDSLIGQREKFQKVIDGATEKTKPSKIENARQEIERLADEISFLEEQISKGREIVPLAATLSLNFGGTSENIYAGMDDNFRRYQAALYTWYETANHAFQEGMTWQNMGGIENDLSGGLYSFKSKLQPQIEEFAGEFNLPVNKALYKLSNLAYAIRKKLRSSH